MRLMDEPLSMTGFAGEIVAVMSGFTLNRTTVGCPLDVGRGAETVVRMVAPSVMVAQYVDDPVGALKLKVAEVPVMPVCGFEPDRTATGVILLLPQLVSMASPPSSVTE